MALVFTVSHQQATGIVLDMHPLMEVECERIRPLNALKTGPELLGEYRKRAERAVHMKPETFRLAKGGETLEVINSTGTNRARGSHHAEWPQIRLPVLLDGLSARGFIEPWFANRLCIHGGAFFGFEGDANPRIR